MRTRYRILEKGHAQLRHRHCCRLAAQLPHGGSPQHPAPRFRALRARKDLQIYGWVIFDNPFPAILAAPDLSAGPGRSQTPHRPLPDRATMKRRLQVAAPPVGAFPAREQDQECPPGLAGRFASAGTDKRCHGRAEAGVLA